MRGFCITYASRCLGSYGELDGRSPMGSPKVFMISAQVIKVLIMIMINKHYSADRPNKGREANQADKQPHVMPGT